MCNTSNTILVGPLISKQRTKSLFCNSPSLMRLFHALPMLTTLPYGFSDYLDLEGAEQSYINSLVSTFSSSNWKGLEVVLVQLEYLLNLVSFLWFKTVLWMDASARSV